MQEDYVQNYILEQAKIEVENTRTWPTKVMGFYVAINFGLVASLIALQKDVSSFTLPCWSKVLLALLIFSLSIWVGVILGRNHLNYLKYRNLQINFQILHLKSLKEKYGLPEEWFKVNEVSLFWRFLGWGFYLYIVIMITLLVWAAISFVF